jgi:pentatricopeptide repeat protein
MNEGKKSAGILSKAWDLIRNGDLHQAITLIESSDDIDAFELATLAHCYYLLQDYSNSEMYSKKSLSINSRQRLALTTQAEILLKRGQLDDACNFFLEAHRHHPHDLYCALRYAHCLILQEKQHEAHQLLQKLTEMHPDQPEILKLLHQTLYFEGNYPAAESLAARLTGISQDQDTVDSRQFIISLGTLEPEKAIEQLNKILTLESYKKDIELRTHLVDLLIHQEDYANAVPHLELLHRIIPRSDPIRFRLVSCLIRTGNPQKALELLESMKHKSNDLKWKMCRIEALSVSGNLQTAMDEAVQALIKHPKERRVRRLLEQLRKRGIRPSPDLL